MEKKSDTINQQTNLLSRCKMEIVQLLKQGEKKLQDEFSLANQHQVTKISKVVLNMGFKTSVDQKYIQDSQRDLSLIAGQKAVITKAKKSISNFKLREGMSLGAKVTLRNTNMWNFIYKLVNVSIPRIRDFRGLSSSSFDKQGNYSMGLRDLLVFPEIDFNSVETLKGLDICIVFSKEDKQQNLALLKHLGFPFR